MAVLVEKIKKNSHISGTNGPNWLKIKMWSYLQVSLRLQGIVFCSKFKGTRDFEYIKDLEFYHCVRCVCVLYGCGDILWQVDLFALPYALHYSVLLSSSVAR